MKHCVCVLFALGLLGAEVSAQQALRSGDPASEKGQASESVDIRGVWKVTELASRAPGEGWEVRGAPYLSQYIFTEKHFSYMYVPGNGPRKRFAGDPNKPTDAEKVEAYNSLVAATGTYSISGQTLTLDVLVHKNPNEMAAAPMTYVLDIDGNSLQMIIANPPFLPGREWRTVLTRIG